mgnify:CR=1 FL=1
MKLSNNSIKSNKNLVEKFFLDNNRFKREKYFYQTLSKKNLNIPKVLSISKNKMCFKKYKFKKLTSQKQFFEELINFLIKINKHKKYKIYAKEYLKSHKQLYHEVKNRFEILSKVKVEKKYLTKMIKIKKYIKIILKSNNKFVQLANYPKIISQSDIGFHNCGISKNKVYFYDFEYSGLDNPIKLICDVYYQPEKKVDKKHILRFINELEMNFKFKLQKNFFIFEKLLKIKMMLIILNIFVTSNVSNKLKLMHNKDINKLKSERVNKAHNYIKFPFIYEK